MTVPEAPEPTPDAPLYPPPAGPPPPQVEPAPGPPPLAGPAPTLPRRLPVRFTGTGGEYFRIWAVNLLLSVATLGIYSAWAKVRKTRWFWGNTQVEGAAFQFHGNPAAILRGRLLFGAFFVAYSLAGHLSLTAAVVASVALGVLGPWLLLNALRFKLTSTTWRGLRFGFDSTVGQAYAALAPAVVLWVLISAGSSALRPGERPGQPPEAKALFGLYLLTFALTPLLHERFKRWQYGATTYGGQRFELQPSVGAFYGTYALTALVGLLPVVAMVVAMVLVFSRVAPSAPGETGEAWKVLVVLYPVALLAYLLPYAYFSARLQRLVWLRTRGGPIGFETAVTTGGLLKVWLRHGLPTVLTLGLYWPFAAVAIARYRLECVTVLAAAPIEALATGQGELERSATGDGASDLLGWDFGL